MTLAELMNCSLPSSSSMLCSPSLTWTRLAGGEHGEGSSPHHARLPQAPGSPLGVGAWRQPRAVEGRGWGSAGVTPGTFLLHRLVAVELDDGSPICSS